MELTEEEIKRLEEREIGLYPDEKVEDNKEASQENQPIQKQVFLEEIPEHNMGWIRLNKDILPSGGLFYSNDVTFYLTNAKINQIKDFSSLSEDDSYTVNERINSILSSCVKTSGGGSRNILEIDKFFMVLAIRDLTFNNRPNKLINNSKCPKCGGNCGIEIFSSNSTFFEFDNNLDQYYNDHTRSYYFEIEKTGEFLDLKPPSISTSHKIDNYYKEYSKHKKIDRNLLNELMYLNVDWSDMDVKSLDRLITETYNWSDYKLTLLKTFVNDFKKQIKMLSYGTCGSCGAEGVSTHFSFRGGLLSIFLIQDIYSFVRRGHV